MRKAISLLLCLVLIGLTAGCMAQDAPASASASAEPSAYAEPTPTATPSTQDASLDLISDVLLQSEAFSIRLLQNGVAADTSGNTVFSPLGVSAALAALYLGSAGETAEDLRALAGFTAEAEDVLSALASFSSDATGTQLVISDRYSLSDSYVQALSAAGMRCVSASLGSAEGTGQLNAAAALYSQAFADAFETTTPSESLLVLTGSAPSLAFDTPFPVLERFQGLFESPDGLVPCDFLYSEGDLPYYEDERVQICAVPMDGGQTELLLILPKGDSMSDTLELLGQYGGDWIGADDLQAYPVRLTLPALSLTQNASLLENLLSMGLSLPFNQTAADFSPMLAESFPLSLSGFYTLTELNISETGINHDGQPPQEANFNSSEAGTDMLLDRPFLLALRSKSSGAPLLLAWINTPNSAL